MQSRVAEEPWHQGIALELHLEQRITTFLYTDYQITKVCKQCKIIIFALLFPLLQRSMSVCLSVCL